MPDVLHWLGVTRIDRMISMSNMKYDAIVGSGIEIIERVEIPSEMLPPDSQVEIDAKIASGCIFLFLKVDFSNRAAVVNVAGTVPVDIKGRTWDDIVH
jgi:hypothetical protein